MTGWGETPIFAVNKYTPQGYYGVTYLNIIITAEFSLLEMIKDSTYMNKIVTFLKNVLKRIFTFLKKLIFPIVFFIGFEEEITSQLTKVRQHFEPSNKPFLANSIPVLLFVYLIYLLCKKKKISVSETAISIYFGICLLTLYYTFWNNNVFIFWNTSIIPIHTLHLCLILLLFFRLYIHFQNFFQNREETSQSKRALNSDKTIEDEKDDNQKRVLNSDKTIEDEKDDILSYKKYAEMLYNDCASTNGDTLSIGIVGSWGLGKTSLMNLMKKCVEKSATEFSIDFNPRNSSSINDIQKDFFEKLSKGLGDYIFNIDSSIRSYVNELNIQTGNSFIDSFISLFQKKVSKEKLEEEITSLGKKIYIFIDDLDRLTGPEIIEVFKLIDCNARFKNIVYVSAYDKDVVNKVLSFHYYGVSENIGNDKNYCYTDKYFDYEFFLPQLTDDNRLDALKNSLINNKIEEKDINRIDKHIISSSLKTIRDIKRFSNMFSERYKTVKKYVDFADYFYLNLIKYLSPELYNKIAECSDPKLFITRRRDPFHISDNIDLKDGYEKEPIVKNSQCQQILKKLFNEEKYHEETRNLQRIRNIRYHKLYFRDKKNEELYYNDFSDEFENAEDISIVLNKNKNNKELYFYILDSIENINGDNFDKTCKLVFEAISIIKSIDYTALGYIFFMSNEMKAIQEKERLSLLDKSSEGIALTVYSILTNWDQSRLIGKKSRYERCLFNYMKNKKDIPIDTIIKYTVMVCKTDDNDLKSEINKFVKNQCQSSEVFKNSIENLSDNEKDLLKQIIKSENSDEPKDIGTEKEERKGKRKGKNK